VWIDLLWRDDRCFDRNRQDNLKELPLRTLLSIFLDVLIFVASIVVYACATIYSLFFPPADGEARSDDLGHFLIPIYYEYTGKGSATQDRED